MLADPRARFVAAVSLAFDRPDDARRACVDLAAQGVAAHAVGDPPDLVMASLRYRGRAALDGMLAEADAFARARGGRVCAVEDDDDDVVGDWLPPRRP